MVISAGVRRQRIEVLGLITVARDLEDSSADNNVPARQPGDIAIAERLRSALGDTPRPVVTARAGISDRTLSRALNAEHMRRGTLVALADALGVKKEWLIEGTGPMHPSPDPTPEEVLREEVATAIYGVEETTVPELSEIIDLDRMAMAIEIVNEAMEKRKARYDNRRLAFLYAGAYDILRAATPKLVRKITDQMVAGDPHQMLANDPDQTSSEV